MESKRMIAVSLAKLQGFRTQRGGMRLHRGLLVSYVLRNAKQAYLGEKYRQLCEYQQYQQQQQQEEDMRQLKQQQQQQWTCGDRSPMTSICSHPALPAAETTALATIIVTEKPVEVSTSDLATTITTTTTLATELPDPSARLCRKRSSSEEGTDDDEGSPPKRPRIQQQHQQQNFQQQEQKPSPPREVSTNKKGPHIVRYHPQPLGQLSLNCMAVAAC